MAFTGKISFVDDEVWGGRCVVLTADGVRTELLLADTAPLESERELWEVIRLDTVSAFIRHESCILTVRGILLPGVLLLRPDSAPQSPHLGAMSASIQKQITDLARAALDTVRETVPEVVFLRFGYRAKNGIPTDSPVLVAEVASVDQRQIGEVLLTERVRSALSAWDMDGVSIQVAPIHPARRHSKQK